MWFHHNTPTVCASMHVCVCVCSSHLIPFISAILEFTAGVWGCSASLVRRTRPSRSGSTPDWWHYLYRSRGHNIKSGTWACVCVCVCVCVEGDAIYFGQSCTFRCGMQWKGKLNSPRLPCLCSVVQFLMG